MGERGAQGERLRAQHEVAGLDGPEVASERIGIEVLERLRDLDQVAYVRFASVYREFKDVQQFLDELKPLLQKSGHAG